MFVLSFWPWDLDLKTKIKCSGGPKLTIISCTRVHASQTSHYTLAETAQHLMLPARGSEESPHVRPLRGGQSAAGESSYAASLSHSLLSQWVPESHGPVAKWSQGVTGKGEAGLRPLHRPLQGGEGRTWSRRRGREGRVQVWRMEGVVAVTAQDECKEGSETCRGVCTHINTCTDTGTENTSQMWQKNDKK